LFTKVKKRIACVAMHVKPVTALLVLIFIFEVTAAVGIKKIPVLKKGWGQMII
jgi:hypothetical protein